jgi:hypothetical protein
LSLWLKQNENYTWRRGRWQKPKRDRAYRFAIPSAGKRRKLMPRIIFRLIESIRIFKGFFSKTLENKPMFNENKPKFNGKKPKLNEYEAKTLSIDAKTLNFVTKSLKNRKMFNRKLPKSNDPKSCKAITRR